MRRFHGIYESAAIMLGIFAAVIGGGVESVAGFLIFLGVLIAAVQCYLMAVTPKTPKRTKAERHTRSHWN